MVPEMMMPKSIVETFLIVIPGDFLHNFTEDIGPVTTYTLGNTLSEGTRIEINLKKCDVVRYEPVDVCPG